MTDIVVVGAGVIGLTCAYALAESGYNVKIIALHTPSNSCNVSEYTSPWAGAHFRPFPSKTQGDLKDYPLTRSGWATFKRLSEQYPESSIKFMTGIDYLEYKNRSYESLLPSYVDGLQNFEVINKSQLPTGVVFGCKYDTYCLNAPLYLEFLERRLRMSFGVEFIEKKLSSLKEAAQLFPGATIINCTGMGLLYDGTYDDSCFTVRGQTLLVKAPKEDCPYLNETVTYHLDGGKFSFVIPRPLDGGIIVGGTREPGETLTTPNNESTKELASNASVRFPELLNEDSKLDIKKVNVGFRPFRKNGVRLEKEVLDQNQIIHCYGFGSSGYEMSWGAAKLVVELVKQPKAKI